MNKVLKHFTSNFFQENPRENLNLAFDIAERYLDIPRMLDAEGMKETICYLDLKLFGNISFRLGTDSDSLKRTRTQVWGRGGPKRTTSLHPTPIIIT